MLRNVFSVVFFAFGTGFRRRIGMVQRDRMWTVVEELLVFGEPIKETRFAEVDVNG